MLEIKTNKTGYKGFNVTENGELYCRDMFFKVGEIARVKGKLSICHNGIHFCWNLNDVHNYYNLSRCVICEVEPVGEIVADTDGRKCCTDALKIVRLLTKEEVLKISNSGSDNTGFVNTGDRNTGNWNTGNWNTGDGNTGNWNTGNWNTGDRNTGFFNAEEHKCFIFDKMSKMTPSEFRASKYYRAIRSASFVLTEWIFYTDEEKANDKAKELIGGYLKSYTWKEACANWWKSLSSDAKETIMDIPGFTKKKFKEITGIDVNKD